GRYNDFNGPCCDYSAFFSRAAPDDSAPTSIPLVIPSSMKSRMRQPINAHITTVGKSRHVNDYELQGANYYQLFDEASLTPVSIDAGSDKSVKRNSIFRLIGEPAQQYLRIVSVGNRTS